MINDNARGPGNFNMYMAMGFILFLLFSLIETLSSSTSKLPYLQLSDVSCFRCVLLYGQTGIYVSYPRGNEGLCIMASLLENGKVSIRARPKGLLAVPIHSM